MVDTLRPQRLTDRRALVRLGLCAAIGAATLMALAVLVVLTHRPHTPELVPGQKPSVFALLGFDQPS